MCSLSATLNWIIYFLAYQILPALVTCLLFVLIMVLASKKVQKQNKEIYDRSARNQEEMIQLLKEIRDSLKKKE